MSETKNKRIRYDNNYLQLIIKKYNGNVIEKYNKLIRDTIIKFICNCGKEGEKVFRYIVKNGGFKCKECTLIDSSNNYMITCLEKFGVDNIFKCEKFKENLKLHNLEKYGVEHSVQSEEIKDKIIKVNLKRYGVKSPLKNSDVRKKCVQTCLDKYGVDNPFKSDFIKDKIKQSNLERHGVEYPTQNKNILKKGIQTSLKKYGETHCSKTDDFKKKVKNTCLKKYGVVYPLQNSKIFNKTCKFKRIKYIFPSGNNCFVQGYEQFALDILIKDMNISEHNIITGPINVPIIWYEFNNKQHRYYTDIYLKDLNKCIEVKSTWTFILNNEQNKLKFIKTKELGYNIEFWIISNKKLIKNIQTIEDFDEYTSLLCNKHIKNIC